MVFAPPLIKRSGAGPAFGLVLHYGDPDEGCASGAVVVIQYCPWCGKEISPRALKPWKFTTLPGSYCCGPMSENVTGEDLVILHNEKYDEYIVPIFDGPPEKRCLGETGVVLRYCPWCGKQLPEGRRPPLSPRDPGHPEVVTYDMPATNPRYIL